MKNKKIILLLFLISCAFALDWEYRVNGPSCPQNYLFRSIELPDGELVSIGYTSDMMSDQHLWILRTDSAGTIISNKEWRNAPEALPVSADTNATGDIGIAGISRLYTTPSAFFALYEPDIDSLRIWVFAPPDTTLEAYGIAPTPDSGFVLSCRGYYGGSNFIRLIKVVPPSWDVEWQSDFDVPGMFVHWSLCCDDDGTSNLAGSISISLGGYFIRIAPDGDSVLTAEFPVGYNPTCIEKAYGEGYIITGDCPMGPWVAKIDTTGSILWENWFGGSDFAFLNLTRILPDKYAIIGVQTVAGSDQNLAVLVIDSLGDSLDCITYGAPDTTERGRGIWQCANGDIVACGMVDIGEYWNGLIVRRELIDTTSITEPSIKPLTFGISAYPNPFNSAINIAIRGVGASDARSGQVGIEIFDISGRLVADLHGTNCGSPQFVPTPRIWRPEKSLGSGIYLVRARIGNSEITKRVVYLK